MLDGSVLMTKTYDLGNKYITHRISILEVQKEVHRQQINTEDDKRESHYEPVFFARDIQLTLTLHTSSYSEAEIAFEGKQDRFLDCDYYCSDDDDGNNRHPSRPTRKR